MSTDDRKALGKAGVTREEALRKMEERVERDLQKRLCSLLSLRDITYATTRTNKRSTLTKGWPDITFALNGQACAWEVKIAGGKLTSDQEIVHCAMLKNGWRVAVIRSLDEARAFLASQP